mmetsp:Transcript_63848/g.208149  ORF Transcript_63848/g.208149 Transcript_63848/m.208149 type:complete len:205 (+) Transcript_63848:1434-2048(+)
MSKPHADCCVDQLCGVLHADRREAPRSRRRRGRARGGVWHERLQLCAGASAMPTTSGGTSLRRAGFSRCGCCVGGGASRHGTGGVQPHRGHRTGRGGGVRPGCGGRHGPCCHGDVGGRWRAFGGLDRVLELAPSGKRKVDVDGQRPPRRGRCRASRVPDHVAHRRRDGGGGALPARWRDVARGPSEEQVACREAPHWRREETLG